MALTIHPVSVILKCYWGFLLTSLCCIECHCYDTNPNKKFRTGAVVFDRQGHRISEFYRQDSIFSRYSIRITNNTQ